VVVGLLFWRGIRAFQLLGFSRFPIREYGMNYDSQPLQTHEIESMKADPTILERVIKSYQLMLDFYGMHLVSKETGLVDRALPPRYFAPRYRNLVRESE
jgi:Opioid growth factor receptor (OGFr) conserved region